MEDVPILGEDVKACLGKLIDVDDELAELYAMLSTLESEKKKLTYELETQKIIRDNLISIIKQRDALQEAIRECYKSLLHGDYGDRQITAKWLEDNFSIKDRI